MLPVVFFMDKGNRRKENVYENMPFTTDTIGLLDSIKDLITTNVIGSQTTSVIAGSDTLTVETTCAYADGDTALIYDGSATDETQAYEVEVMPTTTTTLWISPTPTTNIPSATIVRRIGGQYLRNIYVGNPPVTPVFPCVVIDGEVIADEPLALGGTDNATYAITVSVFADAPTYDEANRTAWAFMKQIEQALTYQINPTACMAIWKWKLGGMIEDRQNNANSTTKAIHLTIFYDEVIQRLAHELPILQSLAQ